MYPVTATRCGSVFVVDSLRCADCKHTMSCEEWDIWMEIVDIEEDRRSVKVSMP